MAKGKEATRLAPRRSSRGVLPGGGSHPPPPPPQLSDLGALFSEDGWVSGDFPNVFAPLARPYYPPSEGRAPHSTGIPHRVNSFSADRDTDFGALHGITFVRRKVCSCGESFLERASHCLQAQVSFPSRRPLPSISTSPHDLPLLRPSSPPVGHI